MRQPSSEPPASRPLVWAYGGITAVLFIILLLTMRNIAGYPLVMVNPDTFLQEGWQAYNADNGQFTMDVPTHWQELRSDDAFVEQVTAVLPFAPQHQPYTVFYPIAEDGVSLDSHHFFLISQQENISNQALNSLTSMLESANFEVRMARMVTTEMGHTRRRVHYLNDDVSCILFVMPSYDRFVVGCEARETMGTHARTFESWLASFQQLPR